VTTATLTFVGKETHGQRVRVASPPQALLTPLSRIVRLGPRTIVSFLARGCCLTLVSRRRYPQLGWYKLSRRLRTSHVFASLKLLALRGSLATIGMRVSAGEYASLRLKAAQMLMTPAQWPRVAAL
jgi:hypothetical protein